MSTAMSTAMNSVTNDGGVRKRVVQAGEGGAVGPGSRVALRYKMSIADCPKPPFDSSASRRNGALSLRLGRRKAILGLEALAASMEVGEQCVGILQPPYAYGSVGLPRCGVPANVSIEVHAELVSAERKEKAKGLADMSPAERFAEAGMCKERGNALFKEAKLEKATAEYQRCLRFIEYVFYKRSAGSPSSVAASKKSEKEENDSSNNEGEAAGDKTSVVNATPDGEVIEEIDATIADDGQTDTTRDSAGSSEGRADGEDGFVEAETSASPADDVGEPDEDDVEEGLEKDPSPEDVRELHVVTLNNLALCLLKLGENKRAEELCSLSMNLDKSNHKPLFYRARARVAMGSWEEAKDDLDAAAKLAPKNMSILVELQRLKKRLNAHKLREKKAAAAMFG